MRIALLLCTLVFAGCHRTVSGDCSLAGNAGSPVPQAHVRIWVLSEADGMTVMMDAVGATMAAWKEHIDERKGISQRLELIDARLTQLKKIVSSAGEAEVIGEELRVLVEERERQTAALVARYEVHAQATYQAYVGAIRRAVIKRELDATTNASGRFTVSIARFGKSALFAVSDQGQVWVSWTTPDATTVPVGQKQLLTKGDIVSSVAKLVYAAEKTQR